MFAPALRCPDPRRDSPSQPVLRRHPPALNPDNRGRRTRHLGHIDDSALPRAATFRRVHAVGVTDDEVKDECSYMERAVETEQSEGTLDHAILLAMVLFLCLASFGSLRDKIAEM